VPRLNSLRRLEFATLARIGARRRVIHSVKFKFSYFLNQDQNHAEVSWLLNMRKRAAGYEKVGGWI
jgi:hypothetical protein